MAALARQDAVVVPSTGWDTLRVTGADRLTWLEGLVTMELKSLRPGQGAWGLVLNRQGKIQSELWVAAAEDSLWLGLAPGTAAVVEPQLASMLIMEDAELERPSEARIWFALHGPHAPARAAELAQAVSGHAVALDWLGLGGAALNVPAAAAPAVLAAAGERLLSEVGWTTLRLERGLPQFGTDFGPQDRPHEAALERRAVNWTKGCYLGQEVVCMQDMRGKVKRSVRVLRVAAPREAALAAGGSVVDGSGQALGAITSCAFSELAGEWLVMGQLKLESLGGALLYKLGDESWSARLGEVL